jgi:hypothetical protein
MEASHEVLPKCLNRFTDSEVNSESQQARGMHLVCTEKKVKFREPVTYIRLKWLAFFPCKRTFLVIYTPTFVLRLI